MRFVRHMCPLWLLLSSFASCTYDENELRATPPGVADASIDLATDGEQDSTSAMDASVTDLPSLPAVDAVDTGAADGQPDAALADGESDGPEAGLDARATPGFDGAIEKHAPDALPADASDAHADARADGSLGDARASFLDAAIRL